MKARQFHGLLLLASDIINELNSGKSAVVQFPDYTQQARWKEHIVTACESVLLLEGEPSTFELIDVNTGWAPKDLLIEFGVSAEPTLERFLTEFGREPLAIAIPRPLSEMPEWATFLADITRFQKALSGDEFGRFLVLFTLGVDLPDDVTRTNLACFQLWNPVEWEDMRLAARTWLGAQLSDAESAWMIATYTGAANLNPGLLADLCESQPRTLADVIAYVTSRFEMEGGSSPQIEPHIDLRARSSWKVPANFTEEWSECGLFGQTMERGARRDLEALLPEHRVRKLQYQIWQEQAAGLLPLVVELSVSANRLLDFWLPAGWRCELAQVAKTDEAETYFLETALLLQFLQGSRRLHLADTPYRLLKQLRHIRNRLAHLQAVELTALQTLWDLYLRANTLSDNVLHQAEAAAG